VFAEIQFASAVFLTLGLMAILVSMWASGRPLFGLALALLLGSSPYLLFEAHKHDNVLPGR
jgi:hypothetical protein